MQRIKERKLSKKVIDILEDIKQPLITEGSDQNENIMNDFIADTADMLNELEKLEAE